MKKILLTICGIALVFVVINVFGPANFTGNTAKLTAQTAMATPTSRHDSAPEPLTMLIFGSCLAGAATLERRRHKE
ncbi:MAG: hypothetical protein DSY50_08745 [Desulfobulbus sp.]|nr:MAG: hypothetical protein DSY50_08745 [Desulfobulbus sp.]RUM37949.1 MAG: hypothetical protein DSY58_02985 [Desulfobulbus sp.]RUM41818.1 MAG: hypothetical protein DSY70_00510 [Desulfobulbus sp.]